MRDNKSLIAMAAHTLAAATLLASSPKHGNVGVSKSRHPKNLRLNRSQRWPYARSYQEAREMSPSDSPVR